MLDLTLTSYGSSLSGVIQLDGFVLSSVKSSSDVYESTLLITSLYFDSDTKGNVYSDSFRVAIDDHSANEYTANSIIFYSIVNNVKKSVAYFSSSAPLFTKSSDDRIYKFLEFNQPLSGDITAFILLNTISASRSGSSTSDGLLHIEDSTTSLDDSYSVYSKTQVDSLFSAIPSWAKTPSKPSYTLDEVNDGSTRKLSNYELKSNLKEGAYVDVDETSMTSSSTNLPTGKAVASYISSLSYITASDIPTNVSDFTNDAGYITSASLPTVNNSTITIKVNSDALGDTFTTNASSNKTINLGLSAVAISGSYTDLSDKPTIPTVNNATLTIKKNTSDTGTTFTANASSDVVANLGLHTVATSGSYTDLSSKPTIPTSTSNLTNDSGFITSSDIPTNVSSFTNDAGYLTSYTETDPTVPSWAKASSKPSYDLDEVADGSTRKLSNYVPTTRKINGTALSSDITLSLDDVSDGSTRKFSNYVLTSTTVNSKALSSNITLSLDDVADGSSRKLSNYELKSNLKEGAYVDVDETTMTSSSTNLPTGKAVASYVTGLGYITSSSLPTVNNSTITIKKNSDDTGDSFTTNASSAKSINLGLATVATSGSYNDLSNKPTIPTVNNATLTIKKNDTDTGTTFTANASSDVTANLGLHSVATSGSYNDLSNKPTIPTVNNATLTIKKNATDSGSTFTANASSDVTVNLGLATVATSGSYNDLTDKPSGGDYLSLIGKSVTIGATGEVGVVYQPTSTYEFQHYAHITNYSSLNSALVSDGWSLTNTWLSTSSYIDNGVVYYNGKTTGGSETKYYKSHTVTNNYTMAQIEQGIVDSGNPTKTFSSSSYNTFTLSSGDPGYDSGGMYNDRTFIYSSSTGKFTVSGNGYTSGTASVPEWKYNAINESSDYVSDEYHWIFSSDLGLYWSGYDVEMMGGSKFSIPFQQTTAYVDSYSFPQYDSYHGLWHRTTTWNNQTELPYGGFLTGYFITIQEDVYEADGDMPGTATLVTTNYYYVFCDPPTFGAFVSYGQNSSFYDYDSSTGD